MMYLYTKNNTMPPTMSLDASGVSCAATHSLW